ncbi:MAG: SpoIID/LytB domain-containing protein [Ignavibacterium sp.]|nr:MAG: SpoIID/LytB domain-containing protein [Ignavibacterium sp.]
MFRNLKVEILIVAILIFSYLLISCSSTKRFTSDEDVTGKEVYKEEIKLNASAVRVLLDEKPEALYITIQSKVYLYSGESKIAEVNEGNVLECFNKSGKVSLNINRKNFTASYFLLQPATGNTIKYNGKIYRGRLQIIVEGNTVELINFVELENYLRGVIAKEMPLGNGNENYEALKAMAVCARTYTLMKMNKGNIFYDIYSDTRDQVYGGYTAEETISNKAVLETKGLILKYDDKPARIYYHSTCGGVSENAGNVFPQQNHPYLTSVEDGSEPYCRISSRYEWTETYSESQFIDKLYNSGVISSINYEVDDIYVSSRFESGRVNELEIILKGNAGRKEIILYGNEIRSRIRTAKKNRLLWSTLFEVKRSGYDIIISGKGFGHGVGLCQWGAIGQSREGRIYKQILAHYFPGTESGRLYD